jgi:hypothetical protein
MRTAWLLAVTSAACWHSGDTATVPPATNPVEVTLSSVTLGDDCGGLAMGDAEDKPVESESQSRNGRRGPSDQFGDMDCVQTSMQLALKSTDGSGSLRVTKVELVAKDGTTLVLGARTPTTWSDDGVYKPWNQQIAANQKLQVSYQLQSPDWDKLGGRWASYSRTFEVRVTLAIDSQERVFETKAKVAALREPMIET